MTVGTKLTPNAAENAPTKNAISLGPLYLAIIQRPKTEVWYTKSRMGGALRDDTKNGCVAD